MLSIALRIWKNKKRKFGWMKRIADVQSIADERDVDMGESAELSLEERITMKEKDESIRMAVNRLPEKFRIVVLLFNSYFPYPNRGRTQVL